MNFFKYLIPALALGALASCSDDDNDYKEQEMPAAPELVSTSVEQNATVSADDVKEINVAYSAPIAINPAERITLNGQGVRVSVVDGNTLNVAVELEHGTAYTLVIPEHALTANRGLHYAPALTLEFATAEAGEILPENPYAELTNPSATEAARNVYDFLCQTSGKKVVTGAMSNVNNNNDMADWVYRVTGKYPALTGYDFIHLPNSTEGGWIDYSDITPAKTQWDNNGLVSYMWHWNAPDSKEDYEKGSKGKYGFYAPGKGSNPTSFDIAEVLKEGTWQHEFILRDIDRVAGYLKQLQDAGIAVIWRPLHEAAGDYRYGAWFWWGTGGDDATKALWRLMYDRLVKTHGLNNLIWVWTAQYQAGYEAQMAASYPGDEYVDIVGVDLYPDNNNSQRDAYAAALAMTEGRKCVALSECGRIPDPHKCIVDKAGWAWFMTWYTYNIDSSASADDFGNTRDYWTSVMSSPFAISREQMPSLK